MNSKEQKQFMMELCKADDDTDVRQLRVLAAIAMYLVDLKEQNESIDKNLKQIF